VESGKWEVKSEKAARTALGGGDFGRVLVFNGSGEEIGWIEAAESGGWLEIGWIELAAEQRGWGHGSEAVRLIEERAAERDVRRARALVPVGNGLALYFWLRLGYRPEGAQDGGPGTSTMMRLITGLSHAC
jgi:GNAT superfamily N-acetyltransferase